jgi:hypothetical protein
MFRILDLKPLLVGLKSPAIIKAVSQLFVVKMP